MLANQLFESVRHRWYVTALLVCFLQAEDGIRDVVRSRGLGDVYKRQLEGRALPVRKAQTEPTQEGVRKVSVKAPAELPVLIMGYKAPVLRDVEKDSEPYALDMPVSYTHLSCRRAI